MAKQDPELAALIEREIVLSRVIDAPRELVYEAWTNREHLIKWFGPKDFSCTTHEIDLRPGGTWRFEMRAPNGTVYPNRIDFLEVRKPEVLVFDRTRKTTPTVSASPSLSTPRATARRCSRCASCIRAKYGAMPRSASAPWNTVTRHSTSLQRTCGACDWPDGIARRGLTQVSGDPNIRAENHEQSIRQHWTEPGWLHGTGRDDHRELAPA
jgi:hypothetical protein